MCFRLLFPVGHGQDFSIVPRHRWFLFGWILGFLLGFFFLVLKGGFMIKYIKSWAAFKKVSITAVWLVSHSINKSFWDLAWRWPWPMDIPICSLLPRRCAAHHAAADWWCLSGTPSLSALVHVLQILLSERGAVSSDGYQHGWKQWYLLSVLLQGLSYCMTDNKTEMGVLMVAPYHTFAVICSPPSPRTVPDHWSSCREAVGWQ